MSKPALSTRKGWRNLVQESVLILLLGYVLLLGGTFNGLVLYRLNLINALLVAAVGAIWIGWRVWQRRLLPRSPLVHPLLALLAAYFLATALSMDPRFIWRNLRRIRSWRDLDYLGRGVKAVVGHLRDFLGSRGRRG